MLALLDHAEPVVATAGEAAMAQRAADGLKPLAATGQAVELAVHEGSKTVATLPVPAVAVRSLLQILEAMGRRAPVSIIPYDAELTTQQAADFLNVSRPFLVKQVEAGKIPHRLVGSHRRIRFSDLLTFEKAANRAGRVAMAEMAAAAERLNLD